MIIKWFILLFIFIYLYSFIETFIECVYVWYNLACESFAYLSILESPVEKHLRS